MSKTTEEKALKGTLRKCRVKDNPMNGTIATIDSINPEVLLNDYAREEWDRAFIELSEMGVIQTTDINALIMLCDMWGHYCHSKDLIRTGNYIITTPNGMEQNSPHLSNWRTAYKEYTTLCKEFGLTPVARTKVNLVPKKKGDAFDDLG